MKKIAHIISHSHWDREWYLPFEKHRYYFIKLMNNIIDKFEQEGNQFQSFHLDGQTVLLEDYFSVHPENREKVKQSPAAAKKRFLRQSKPHPPFIPIIHLSIQVLTNIQTL
ncbi:hypothetical protein [Bacillus sp. ISL-7]|uniref:hypothetical protein n=1 Tax=Bacillus sp. ISL-7 TaxID=2819136 RepID=UPI001BEC38BB|nr:hypothetical protein [Bacillus sp. ISL-7]MBT2738501.1 hypothetical protein [Bacillus sp. ISL-7]